MPDIIVVAGATGDLGGRIVKALHARGAGVRALVRREAEPGKRAALMEAGATVMEADTTNTADLTAALAGAACVVSALSGLRDVVVDTQTRLLDAAIAAGVPRFIPSDYALDFSNLPPDSNRNLNIRQAFKATVDRRHAEGAISATSVLNGAFMDLLAGQAPLILFRFRRVLYWQNADQKMDFTTKDDVAAFTAAAALDPTTPRTLRIAGSEVSARDLAAMMSEMSGGTYRLLRAGSLQRLTWITGLTRRLFPQEDQLYNAWQGMQYLHNMFSGIGKLQPLDNGRYPEIRWTTARDVLAARVASAEA